MDGVGAVVLGSLLVAAFLGIMAVMLLQEARSRGRAAEPVYGIEEATDHAMSALAPDQAARLGRDNVRRILEWQVDFLQRLARDDEEVPIIVGSTDGTVEHIRAGLERTGLVVRADDIAAVLDTQGSYLRSLGIVGDVVDPGEVFDD